MMEVAYLLADQLDQPETGACAMERAPRSYIWNDDGSTPWICGHSHRRIDPVTGICGYHSATRWHGRRPLLTHRYDGAAVLVKIPA